MANNKRATQAELEIRAKAIAELLAKGARGIDCVAYAAKEWGIGARRANQSIADARKLLREDWKEVDRAQMMAEILARYATLEQEARECRHYAVALGCINGAAKVAQLIS